MENLQDRRQPVICCVAFRADPEKALFLGGDAFDVLLRPLQLIEDLLG